MKVIRSTLPYSIIFFFGSLLILISCQSEATHPEDPSAEKLAPEIEKNIIDTVMASAHKVPLNSAERRKILDSAIAENPSVAYFYQQRAMPLYKQNKDEIGLPFLEKAAQLNPEKYLDYMAFMKCIFSKDYKSAIKDFEKVLDLSGEAYVMDHTYYFYIGISYLQLNEFEKAKEYLQKSIAQTEAETNSGREWVHFLDLMYLGIAHMELHEMPNAVMAFDEALLKYPNFGDIKYYKAFALYEIGETDKAQKLFSEAKEDILKGNTINEDNVIYETYPYQVQKIWFGH